MDYFEITTKLPTRQRHVLIMSPRRLCMTSYFIPLLGLYESLPDVIFQTSHRRPYRTSKGHAQNNVRKYYKYDVLYWSLKGRLKDGPISDVIFITRTFLSKYQNHFIHKYHIFTFLRNMMDIQLDYHFLF